jgi:phage virion morphogenesis protein
MAGAEITIKVDDREAREAFDRLMRLGRQPAPVLRHLGERLLESTRARFEAGRDPDGRPWKPLAQPTTIQRAGGAKAFTKKGALRKPAQDRIARIKMLVRDRQAGLMATLRYQVGGDTLQLGTDKVYGAIHQFGGVIRAKGKALAIPSEDGGVRLVKSVTIPARPYLGVSSGDTAVIREVLREHASLALFGRKNGL